MWNYNCCRRCDELQNAVEESHGTVPRDTVARDTVDHQDADDVSTPVGCPTSTTGDGTTPSVAVEPEPRPLFEDISDAEDEPAQLATTPRPADVSPVVLFHSPVGSASTFDRVQSWASSVSNDCSNSLPAAAAIVASTCPQFFPAAAAGPPASSAATGPAAPDAPFYANLTSPPPPPLEDMVTAGILVPRAMTPLTIDTDFDTTLGPEFTTDFGDASHSGLDVMDTAQQPADDVTDTSHSGSAVTLDVVVRSPQTAIEQPPATSSVSVDETVSPSPPKIPRLRIVMGAAASAAAGDASQSSTSPGSAASLPYVVTVDDTLSPVDVTEQSASSPRRDVTDDVSEPPTSALVESVSRQQSSKVKHSAAAKVRSVYRVLSRVLHCAVVKDHSLWLSISQTDELYMCDTTVLSIHFLRQCDSYLCMSSEPRRHTMEMYAYAAKLHFIVLAGDLPWNAVLFKL